MPFSSYKNLSPRSIGSIIPSRVKYFLTMAAGLALRLALAVVVCAFLLSQQGADAKEFKVGGSMSWVVPPNDHTQLYNLWAEKNRFMIGDSLVFIYDAGKDSVLQVDQDAYDNCKTDSYIQSYKDGHTVIKLNHSGPFYFISGNADHCHNKEKLVVVVMSERRKSASPSPQPTPAPAADVPPSPSALGGSASSPTAPAGSSPAPVPSPTSDSTPESDDSSHKKKNSAFSTMIGVFGSLGAFIGSLLVLVL